MVRPIVGYLHSFLGSPTRDEVTHSAVEDLAIVPSMFLFYCCEGLLLTRKASCFFLGVSNR